MRYLIVQEWDNTKGNHAGMKHMCDLLAEKYPNKYEVIVKSAPEQMKRRKNKIFAKLLYNYDRKKYLDHIRKQYKVEYLQICKRMFENLREGDEVFLLEYNLDEAPQYDLAVHIKKNYPFVKIYALSHLTPSNIKQKKIEKNVILWDEVVDKELTLGTSLSAYFVEMGIMASKISTGFHYVDLDYYHPIEKKTNLNDRITIIAMGNMQRNYKILSSVVSHCPQVNWIICGGARDLSSMFNASDNVTIKGYMNEEELRNQMNLSDVSINVMDDTVGSNVITTSLAMGLALVVTDVGSIRDYCSDKNAVFCENTVQSLIQSVNELAEHADKVKKMGSESLEFSSNLSIENVDAWFDSL